MEENSSTSSLASASTSTATGSEARSAANTKRPSGGNQRGWFRRRYLLVAITAWLLFFNPWHQTDDMLPVYNPKDDRPPLTPEQIANVTFQQNAFFADQMIFSKDLLEQFSKLFEGAYYPAGTVVRGVNDAEAYFMIVENGSLRVMPKPNEYVSDYRHGDSLGGLDILYGTTSNNEIHVTNDMDAFVWRVSADHFYEFVTSDPLLTSVIERKFLQTLVEKRAKRPVIIFPGFASTQLISWKPKKCVGTHIEVGERVWVNLEKILHSNFVEDCWFRCMSLSMLDQSDPPDCKLRPQEGLSSIYDLLPGPVIGPLTTIFRNIVFELAHHFSYDISNLVAVPYDWRLAPSALEDRDNFFSRLKLQFEQSVTLNHGNAGITLCHSMGCNIIDYFIQWLKENYPNEWEEWVDHHIWMYVTVAAPLLGSAEAVKSFVSGMTFGLPVDVRSLRQAGATWSSGHWLTPLQTKVTKRPERESEFHIWPEQLVKILLENGETVIYSADDVWSGKLYKDMAVYQNDTEFENLNEVLDRYYKKDKILVDFGIKPPIRPPVRKILAFYGVDVNTDIGFSYKQFSDPLNGNKSDIRLIEEIYESAGGEIWKRDLQTMFPTSSAFVGTGPYKKSGDGTVSYSSLSWVNTWHYENYNVTHVNATKRIDLDRLLVQFGEMRPNFESNSILSAINIAEPSYTKMSSWEIDQKGEKRELTVIEISDVGHRDVIKDPYFIKHFKNEFYRQVRQDFIDERRSSTESKWRFTWLEKLIHSMDDGFAAESKQN